MIKCLYINVYMGRFPQDGNLPWFLSFFWNFWPAAATKRSELALKSQLFLRNCDTNISRKPCQVISTILHYTTQHSSWPYNTILHYAATNQTVHFCSRVGKQKLFHCAGQHPKTSLAQPWTYYTTLQHFEFTMYLRAFTCFYLYLPCI